MQACRSAGRAPGPFPDGQKTRRLSVRLHSVGLGLSSARKAIFLVTNFGMRNRPSESREFVTDPFLPFSVLVRCPPSLPIPLIDGGPVVRPVRGGDGGKKVSDVAIEIYCRDCGGGQPRERDIPPQEMDT